VRKSGLSVVYFVVFLDMLGFGVMIPVVRDLTTYLVGNSSLTWLRPEVYMGILMASYSGAQMLSAPFLGRLSDIYGRKPVFLFSALGNVASYAIWITSTTYWPFLAGRILSGATGGNIAIAQSIIADATTVEQRPRAMGLLGASIGMGFVVGPFLGGLMININHISSIDMSAFNQYWSIGGVCLALAVLSVLLIVINHFGGRPDLLNDDRVAFWQVFSSFGKRATRKIYSVQLLSQLSFVSFEVLFAWILQRQYHFDLRETYYFFGAQGVLLALVQGGLYRRLEKRKPPAAWVKMGLLLSFVGMSTLPWIGYLPAGLFVGISLKVAILLGVLLVLSIALGFGNPSMSAYASINAPKSEQGLTMGNMQALGALARFGAPVLATGLYAVALPLPFLVGGIFCLVAWFIFRKE
jgi:MFS transporter, DHA1 family, tetracycline resistance protein